MLVNRLMRLSQQERRIAVQLLQARHEKETIRNNTQMLYLSCFLLLLGSKKGRDVGQQTDEIVAARA